MKKPNIENGPWSVRQHDVIYSDKSGRFIADCERTPHDKRPAPPDEKDRIHAKFLAAAPAMAEALEAMLQAYAPFHQESVDNKGGEDGLHSAVKAARNALKSAGYEF